MKKLLPLTIAIIALATPAVALATSPFDDGLIPWLVQCGTTTTNLCTLKDAFGTAARLINLLIYASGIVAAAMVVYAGWQMLMASLNGKPAEYEAGKKRLGGMVWGMIIIFSAYVVINSIMVWVFKINFDSINF